MTDRNAGQEEGSVVSRRAGRRLAVAQARHDLVADLAADVRGDSRLLRTRDVALLFQVSERAVAEWARRGKIPSVRTPGGHRRYPAGRILDILADLNGR